MTLSNYLHRLEERNFIRRTTDPTDGGAKLVEITDQAHPVLAMIEGIGAQLHADISDIVVREQPEVIRTGLKQIRLVLITMRPEKAQPAATS